MGRGVEGRTCLVTGATSGIGYAIATRLMEEGQTVIAVGRREERMAPLAKQGAYVQAMDIASEASILEGFAAIEGRFGSVQVLINCAGTGLYGPMEDVPVSSARDQFEINVLGPARLTQLVLPAMRAQGWGRIVNISSVAGKVHMPLTGWYAASKHALEGWSDCLRVEVRPFGIAVVIIEPGAIKTQFGAEAVKGLEALPDASAYAARIQARAKALAKNKDVGSAPEVVAEAVWAAIAAVRPRARYAVGFAAKPMIGLRRWLGDGLFDRLVERIE